MKEQVLETQILNFLPRLGWEPTAISSWKSRTIRRRGLLAKVRFITIFYKNSPHLIIAIPQHFRLTPFSRIYQRYLDMDEIIRLVINFFQDLYPPYTLLLLFDGQTGFLYKQPEELLLSHCDNPRSFNEKILGLLRPELAFNPEIFSEINQQFYPRLGKELHQWLRMWMIKLGSVANLNKQSILNFLYKILLWRVAVITQMSKSAKQKMQRYIFPEENFSKKKNRMPDAGKDILQVLESLANECHIEFCRLAPEDILLIRRTENVKLLCRLLWELNLLGSQKFFSYVLANCADREHKRPQATTSRYRADEMDSAKAKKKKTRSRNYVIQMPLPRYIEMDRANYVTLVKEIRGAFKDILAFRTEVVSETKYPGDRVYIQEDLFIQERTPIFDYEDILKILVSNKLKVITRNEGLRECARFLISASLMELRHKYNLPVSAFPSLTPIFTSS
ncbi:hypothetical protein J7M23_12820 [Candidatus Sumerlaeota bacterium]|nr:hypothetical protein [Candidatus Sumerlaeota bacterium]